MELEVEEGKGKEKEEIQREMVKLRREILERRHTVEEAWKM